MSSVPSSSKANTKNLLVKLFKRASSIRFIESKPPVSPEEDKSSFNLTQLLTIFCALTTLLITLIRMNFSSLPSTFSWLGIANSLVFFLLWGCFRIGLFKRYAAGILLCTINLVLVPMVIISGGLSSQFAPLVALMPFMFTLLGGFSYAIWVNLAWSLVWIMMLKIGMYDLDLTQSPWEQGKAMSKALWLILSTNISTFLAIKFENTNRRQKKELIKLANQDNLTGVYNRRGMTQLLNNEIYYCLRSKTYLSVMFVDVDFFKKYNDLNGHVEGDKVLIDVANCLVNNTREGQDTVARYGGEEFIIIMRSTNALEAKVAAEKIRQSVQGLQIKYSDVQDEFITVTIGLYSTKCINEQVEDILNTADQALYLGKQQGRNRVISA